MHILRVLTQCPQGHKLVCCQLSVNVDVTVEENGHSSLQVSDTFGTSLKTGLTNVPGQTLQDTEQRPRQVEERRLQGEDVPVGMEGKWGGGVESTVGTFEIVRATENDNGICITTELQTVFNILAIKTFKSKTMKFISCLSFFSESKEIL